MSTAKKIFLTLLCLFSIVVGTGYFLGLAYFQTHFKIGTTINGFHCSFKSVGETEELLSRKVSSYAMAVETRNNGVEKVSADNVGLKFVGRSELVNILNEQDYRLWFLPDTSEHNLSVDCYDIDKESLNKEISQLKCVTDMVKSESAHIVDTGSDTYQVAEGVRGTELDIEKATSIIETGIRQWKESVNLEEAGCYIEAEDVSEKELQDKCDILNSIQDTIITYDFGDRKETIDFDVIKEKFIDNYGLSIEKMQKYASELADKYDTVAAERKFVTYDDRTMKITGGDYGWLTDIDATAEELMQLIVDDTIDVVKPVYKQEAMSRQKNDLGYSYLEIDKNNGKIVLYIEGTPAMQTVGKVNSDVKPGFYKASKNPDERTVSFGGTKIYQFDISDARTFSGNEDISDFGDTGVQENSIAVDDIAINAILDSMGEDWPVVIYK